MFNPEDNGARLNSTEEQAAPDGESTDRESKSINVDDHSFQDMVSKSHMARKT